ncbi:MAG: transposase family protein [Planctomycetia bacterium]|nr:transposase family protein [Planctomycetia bacterium]
MQSNRSRRLRFFQPYSRVTHRLAAYIHELCKMLTITELAKYFGMNWKTVKAIDKFFLNDNTRRLTISIFAYWQ